MMPIKPKVAWVERVTVRSAVPRYRVEFSHVFKCKLTGIPFGHIVAVAIDELDAWAWGTKFIEERWDDGEPPRFIEKA
jgi:hypothetical protein